MSGSVSVKDALGALSLGQDLVNYLLSNRANWENFGKMNSHIYRSILMKHMQDAGLNGEQKFMVFFLFSVIKNRDRILKALDMMDDADKSRPWFGPVRTFISARVTQYVSDVTRSRKFPGVNIPNCNPGLDVLVYCLITHPNKRSIVELSHRPTFCQLYLDEEMQDVARAGYAHYWDYIVQGSKNPDAVSQNLPKPQFREEYYNNSAGDKYQLVDLDLKEIPPNDPIKGYTLEEIAQYLKEIDSLNEFDDTKADLNKELERVSPLETVEASGVPLPGSSRDV